MGWLLIIGAGLWLWLGSPAATIADWFWPDSAAPWEEVDAFYYPNPGNLTIHRETRGLSSVDECRTAVRAMAIEFNDLNLERGDYECGVGPTGDSLGSISVYRITAE